MPKPNIDFFVKERAYRDEQWVRMILLAPPEQEWLFNIQPANFVYRRHSSVDIQAYVTSRFTAQIDFTQGMPSPLVL